MDRQSFIFKKAWRDAISELPAKVRAEVYVAIIEYGFTGEAPQLKSMARMAFAFVKSEIDRDRADAERQQAESEKMRKIVQSRWAKEDRLKTEKTSDAPVDAPVYTDVDTHVYTDVDTDVDTENEKDDTTVYTDVDTDKNSADTSLIIKNKEENKDIKEDIIIQDNIKLKERESEKRKKALTGQKTTKTTVDARKEEFYKSLIPYVHKYGRDMIREFFDYWSELNRPGTKMRYELEKTWQTSRRLVTWASRDKNFVDKGNNGNNHEQDKRRGLEADFSSPDDYKTTF
ncbi:MAG: DUF6291 domain-containing protein [Bacteroidales bacterium]|nr:DUF6291 domain-containing protein [Bacteroidales bacterium]